MTQHCVIITLCGTVNIDQTYVIRNVSPFTTERGTDRLWRTETGPVMPTDILRYTPMSAYPTDPRLQDGSDGISSNELVQSLMKALYSACRVLERLDAEGAQSLRHYPQYTAMLEQLMAPVGLSFPLEDGKRSAVSSGKAAQPSDRDGRSPSPSLTVKNPKRASNSCRFLC